MDNVQLAYSLLKYGSDEVKMMISFDFLRMIIILANSEDKDAKIIEKAKEVLSLIKDIIGKEEVEKDEEELKNKNY